MLNFMIKNTDFYLSVILMDYEKLCRYKYFCSDISRRKNIIYKLFDLYINNNDEFNKYYILLEKFQGKNLTITINKINIADDYNMDIILRFETEHIPKHEIEIDNLQKENKKLQEIVDKQKIIEE